MFISKHTIYRFKKKYFKYLFWQPGKLTGSSLTYPFEYFQIIYNRDQPLLDYKVGIKSSERTRRYLPEISTRIAEYVRVTTLHGITSR